MTALPKTDHPSEGWICTPPGGNPVELRSRANAQKALDAGWTVTTYTEHIMRLQARIDAGDVS